jgi:hypothetical protein
MNAMQAQQPPENPAPETDSPAINLGPHRGDGTDAQELCGWPVGRAIHRGKGMQARESGGSPQRRDGRRGACGIHCGLTVAFRLNALSVAGPLGPSRAAELKAAFSQEVTEATEKTLSVPSVTCEKQNAASRNFHVPFLHAGSSPENLCNPARFTHGKEFVELHWRGQPLLYGRFRSKDQR